MRNLLFLFTIVIILCGCNQSSNQQVAKNVQEDAGEIIFLKLDKIEFGNKIQELSNAQLVDVRTPEEYSEGFIEGAQNIDYRNDSFKENISKLNKNQPVLLYCRSGGRSGDAAEVLKDMGFLEIYDLKGGFMAWSEE